MVGAVDWLQIILLCSCPGGWGPQTHVWRNLKKKSLVCILVGKSIKFKAALPPNHHPSR